MEKARFNLPVLLLALISITGFSACGGLKPPLFDDAAVRSSSRPDEPSPKQITLKLWHIWVTDSESNKEPFEKALAEWNKARPDIQLQAEATENEAYKNRIRTAMAVNEAPDIFYCWGAGFARPFVDAGKVLALDGYLEDGLREKLIPGSLEHFTYGERVYGLPVYMIAGVLYCNEELFRDNGLEIPETYDELLEAVRSFKEKGITPMAVGGKDSWTGMFYHNILAIRTAGIELCNKALNKEASFDRPEFVEAAFRLSELVKAGAFDESCMTLTRDEAEAEFKNGKIAMYYNGNWVAGSLDREECPVKGKIAVRNFPVLADSAGDPGGFVGGAIDTFMISSGTKHREEAVSALIKLAESFCRESYLAGATLPAWKLDLGVEDISSPLAGDISRLLESGTGFVLAWDTYLTGSEVETHKNLVADIFADKLTPEEFARKMQQINE